MGHREVFEPNYGQIGALIGILGGKRFVDVEPCNRS
jgi:hypothetical protein